MSFIELEYRSLISIEETRQNMTCELYDKRREVDRLKKEVSQLQNQIQQMKKEKNPPPTQKIVFVSITNNFDSKVNEVGVSTLRRIRKVSSYS